MPAFNAADFISESIKSLQAQTYENWELLVVDDGSTDDTAQLINEFASLDNRIRYFYKVNSGQGAARNLGISRAHGQLLAFLDADDVWFPDKLQKQVAFMEFVKADVVFSDIAVLSDNQSETALSWVAQDVFYKGNDGLKAFLQSNRIPFVSALARKDSILAVDGFEESNGIQYGEDYDLWIRMLQNGCVFAGSKEKLAVYRRHDAQTTKHSKAMLQVIQRLSAMRLPNNELELEKNKTICIWIRRFIKSAKDQINKNELHTIINCLPSSIEKQMFRFFDRFISPGLVSKLIFLSCRSAVK